MQTLRRATKNDTEIIVEYCKLLLEYESKIDKSVRTDPKTLKYVEKFEKDHLKMRNVRFFVAEIDGKVVGYISGWLSKRNVAAIGRTDGYICDLFVLEKYRNKCIGHKLVKEILNWFMQKNVEYIEVYTYFNNNNGKRFWEAMGFNKNMIKYMIKNEPSNKVGKR